MCPICKKLQIDFDYGLKNLPEHYTANEIEILAHLGMILSAHNEVCEKNDKNLQIVKQDNDHKRDDVREELQDAENYYNRYVETGDTNYKQIAKDELRHADFFLKHARMVATTDGHHEDIQHYTDWYNHLLAKLNSPNPY